VRPPHASSLFLRPEVRLSGEHMILASFVGEEQPGQSPRAVFRFLDPSKFRNSSPVFHYGYGPAAQVAVLSFVVAATMGVF